MNCQLQNNHELHRNYYEILTLLMRFIETNVCDYNWPLCRNLWTPIMKSRGWSILAEKEWFSFRSCSTKRKTNKRNWGNCVPPLERLRRKRRSIGYNCRGRGCFIDGQKSGSIAGEHVSRINVIEDNNVMEDKCVCRDIKMCARNVSLNKSSSDKLECWMDRQTDTNRKDVDSVGMITFFFFFSIKRCFSRENDEMKLIFETLQKWFEFF